MRSIFSSSWVRGMKWSGASADGALACGARALLPAEPVCPLEERALEERLPRAVPLADDERDGSPR